MRPYEHEFLLEFGGGCHTSKTYTNLCVLSMLFIDSSLVFFDVMQDAGEIQPLDHQVHPVLDANRASDSFIYPVVKRLFSLCWIFGDIVAKAREGH